MTQESDYDRAERILGPELRVLEKLFGPLNPETLFRVPEAKPVARVINLQRRYDVVLTENRYLPKEQRWEARDMVTFDPDPESRWNIVGRGAASGEAVSDLLEQIGAEVAKDEP